MNAFSTKQPKKTVILWGKKPKKPKETSKTTKTPNPKPTNVAYQISIQELRYN